MHQPQLLLLDEPTAGVDPKARREFWDEIHELAADGLTVLVSTHYMDEAERCHRIVYIAYGTIVARGTVRRDHRRIRASQPIVVTRPRREPPRAHARTSMPGVEQVAPFGDDLHVVGSDHRRSRDSVARGRAAIRGASGARGETTPRGRLHPPDERGAGSGARLMTARRLPPAHPRRAR